MSINRLARAFSSSIPRQHGGWLALIACLMFGIIVAGNYDLKSFIFIIATIFGFLLRFNIFEFLKEGKKAGPLIIPTLFYSIILFAAILILLFYFDLFMLIPLSILPAISALSYMYFQKIGKANGATSEIMGMAGLSAAAPAAYYASLGSLIYQAFGLWIITVLFLSSSVVVVRYLVRKKAKYHSFKQFIVSAKIPVGVCSVSIAAAYLMGAAAYILPRYAFVSLLLPLIIILASSFMKHRIKISMIGIIATLNIVVFVISASFAFL